MRNLQYQGAAQPVFVLLSATLLACGAPAQHQPTPSATEVQPTAQVREVSISELPRDEPDGLPDGVSRWAVAAAWGDTYFVARTDEGRIDVVVDGVATDFASGDDIVAPRALVVDGGRLIVGTREAIIAIDLHTRDQSVVAPVAGVSSLAVDHAGYYIASTAPGRPPVRVASDGETTTLVGVPSGPIAFDPVRRELYVVDETTHRVRVYDYVELVGEDPEVWAARDGRLMRPFTVGGLGVTGAEYWPNRGDTPTQYPDDVLWGFYPEEGVVFEGVRASVSATPVAVVCAEQSFTALRAFIAEAPDELRQSVALGTSDRFYLWVNDYSEATDPFPHDVRPNRFWYWQRDPSVVGRIPGYWKWETTLTQTGECRVPTEEQAGEYLVEKLAELRAATP